MSTSNNNAAFISMLFRTPDMPDRWSSSIFNRPLLVGGPSAFAPDNSVFLLARPSGIGRYHVRNFDRATIGAEDGRFETGCRLSFILFTSDSSTAILVREDGVVDFIDPETLLPSRPSLNYSPIGMSIERKIRHTYAAISPDDRYIVINSGSSRLNVLDLVANTSSSVELNGVSSIYGLGFNYHATGNVLAVNGGNAVAVYDAVSASDFRLLARTSIPSQTFIVPYPDEEVYFRPSSLAWTGRGDGIVAAIGAPQEFRILDVRQDETEMTLSRRLDFEGCESPQHYQIAMDVISLNDRYHTPTPTPTPTASPTATAIPSSPPPPTATSPPTATVTSRPSPTATVVPPTSTTTPTPAPIYLPVALREACPRTLRRTDVVLVVDASTSMLDRDAAGTVKLTAALDAARAFLGLLVLDPAASGDQAAVVTFHAEAVLLQPLTADRTALDAALGRVATAPQTCLVCAVEAAAAELASPRHVAGHTPAVVILTDGRANPRPASEAVAAAAVAKARGVVFFTVALGDDVDADALAAIAAPAGRFFRSADAAGLAAIYAEVAEAIPCPTGAFWGRR